MAGMKLTYGKGSIFPLPGGRGRPWNPSHIWYASARNIRIRKSGMQLDIRTLLVAVALATALCAAARILLCRMHPGLPGLGQWAWGSVAGAVSLGLIAARGAIPEILSLSVAQLLVIVGFVLAWDGFRRFLVRPALAPPVLVGIMLAVVGLTAISQFDGTLSLRSILNSGAIAAISTMIARELLVPDFTGQVARRTIGWIYGANAVFFLGRGLVAFHGVVEINGLASGNAAALSLLWWLCMSISVTLCMALMTGGRLQDDLNQQASRDPLTGALNRRAFALVAEKELARARRGGRSLALLMMDLDHFKQINDHLGHAGGDAMLCLFVRLAGGVLRGEDVFCRFGGEEFVALLPDSSEEQALAVAERLRFAFAEAAAEDVGDDLPFALTVSVGISALQADEDLEGMIRRADLALYRAKAEGRNRSEMAGTGEV